MENAKIINKPTVQEYEKRLNLVRKDLEALTMEFESDSMADSLVFASLKKITKAISILKHSQPKSLVEILTDNGES